MSSLCGIITGKTANLLSSRLCPLQLVVPARQDSPPPLPAWQELGLGWGGFSVIWEDLAQLGQV